jgi:hypothetical protein
MSTDEPGPAPETTGLEELAELAADADSSTRLARAAGDDPHVRGALAALRATRDELSRLAETPSGEPTIPSDVAAVLNISLEWEVLARVRDRTPTTGTATGTGSPSMPGEGTTPRPDRVEDG